MSGENGVPRIAGLDLGAPPLNESEDAKRRRWREWVIALVSGRMMVGRLCTRVGNAEPERPRRYLKPPYDCISGFQPGPQGLSEVHRCFPFAALTVPFVDLPDQGVVLVPFTDLSGMEIDGFAGNIKEADDLLAQMRAVRSGIVIANQMPPIQGK